MNPHWFCSLIRIRIRILRQKAGSGSALKPIEIHNTDETGPLKITCGSHGVDEVLQGGAQLPLLLLLQAKVQGVEDDHPQLRHRLQFTIVFYQRRPSDKTHVLVLLL
jgi:hypothetical protein